MSKHKSLLTFLAKFLGTYLVLTLGYQLYLNHFVDYVNRIADPYTYEVSSEVVWFLQQIGYNSKMGPRTTDPWINIIIDQQVITYINEGCNAIAVMIIMLSFIFAFGKKLIPTLLYALISLLFIHIINILRICFINYIVITYPEYTIFAHDILFPIIIYGAIVFICVVWLFYSMKSEVKDD